MNFFGVVFRFSILSSFLFLTNVIVLLLGLFVLFVTPVLCSAKHFPGAFTFCGVPQKQNKSLSWHFVQAFAIESVPFVSSKTRCSLLWSLCHVLDVFRAANLEAPNLPFLFPPKLVLYTLTILFLLTFILCISPFAEKARLSTFIAPVPFLKEKLLTCARPKHYFLSFVIYPPHSLVLKYLLPSLFSL